METTFPILIEWATIRPLLLGYFSTVINTFFKPAPSKRVVGEKFQILRCISFRVPAPGSNQKTSKN
ncbi:hypothetical protein U2A4042590069 [Corynebacterium striatum]|nr:hypothetical protein U2A4042590069 [Corynebacterium striatum]